jgi:hypothetical protein
MLITSAQIYIKGVQEAGAQQVFNDFNKLLGRIFVQLRSNNFSYRVKNYFLLLESTVCIIARKNTSVNVTQKNI